MKIGIINNALGNLGSVRSALDFYGYDVRFLDSPGALEDVQVVVLGIAAAVGSLTNTVLVLSAAVLRGYIPKEAAWGIGLTHGIPEVIVAGIVTVAVVSALRQVGGRRRRAKL